MDLGLTFLGWNPLGRISRTIHDALRAILNVSARAVGQTRAVLQADLILLLPWGVPRPRRCFQRGAEVVFSWDWSVEFDTVKLGEGPGAY